MSNFKITIRNNKTQQLTMLYVLALNAYEATARTWQNLGTLGATREIVKVEKVEG